MLATQWYHARMIDSMEKIDVKEQRSAVPGDTSDDSKEKGKSGEGIPREAMERARECKGKLMTAEEGNEVTIKTAKESGEVSISGTVTHRDTGGRLSLRLTKPTDGKMMGIDILEGGPANIKFGELADDGSSTGEQFTSGILTRVEIQKKKVEGGGQ